MVQLLWETVIHQKIKNRITIDPVIPLLGSTPKESKAGSQIDYLYMFMAALFPIAKTWEKLKCPLRDEWLSKM
jgi:hypothetical protein